MYTYHWFFFAPLINHSQLGVSIPVDTRETPVMIISELCSNGDLFDYLRGSHIPAVRRMVSYIDGAVHGLASDTLARCV
jgi:hypothetical protein